jgi:hypothetical protein
MANKKQTIINVKDMKGMSFDNPKDLLAQLFTFEKLLAEASPEQKIEIAVSMHACAKAFYDMLCEKFNCGDAAIETMLAGLPANSGLGLSINNKSYTYTNEHIEEDKVDKAWIKSQGYKSQVELCEDYKSKGLPLPSGLVLSTKTIAEFNSKMWNGLDPIAVKTEYDVQNIKIKENKNK